MEGTDFLYRFLDVFLRCFRKDRTLVRLLDLPLPTIERFDGRDDMDAGSEFFFTSIRAMVRACAIVGVVA